MPGDIQILPSGKINKEKWNNCVAIHENGLIYSHSDYLDHVCDNWSAVVLDDYKAIMALPWRQKFGIRYIYQPAFIQQLGMIGDDNIPLEKISRFIKYGDLLLNYQNAKAAAELSATPKTNFVIDLSEGYEVILSRYKKDLVLNLKKAEKESLKIVAETDIGFAVKMYKLLYQQRMDDLHDSDFNNFMRLTQLLSKNEMCFARKIVDEKGTALAIGLFLKDNKRLYNLMNSTTDIGRTREANPFLLDGVLREFAGEKLIFDFEGSDIHGVRSFYEKFGGVDQPYFFYHYNQLPGWLKLLKR